MELSLASVSMPLTKSSKERQGDFILYITPDRAIISTTYVNILAIL